MSDASSSYDVVVIGGGHAGAEAAWAAASMGAQVALVTMTHDAIGRMSCNPAIGGLGKGQMVREIDALGGLMGLAIDRAGIQFRMLNRSKGPAVWAPRAQADRDAYAAAVQSLIARSNRVTIVEGAVEEILTREINDGNHVSQNVRGVALQDGRQLDADAVIMTTGTFLRGLMHCGSARTAGGRVGEQAAVGLSGSLKALGFTLGRLKTGTPPRIHRDTIDYDVCTPQPGDDFPTPFSTMTDYIRQPQIGCWITWTNPDVHEVIRANLHRAPMYSGQIESTGPRYCPSIEDKVVRFADKLRHQVFLEPEGYDDERVYCNGISTSLPKDVQETFVRRVEGLGRARIIQHGYAVEYDWVPTHQTRASLETKLVGGLYLAGQINGTSGYEEAAAQGLMAGVNAVCKLGGKAPFILRRDQAYIGVMIDDLMTKPPTEPYRMFTSRAEFRLLLRSDNADIRLTPLGREVGTVDDVRWERFGRDSDAVASLRLLCDCGQVDGLPLTNWLQRPEADVPGFAAALGAPIKKSGLRAGPFGVDKLQRLLIEFKYQGYITRQARQVERLRELESRPLPVGLDYQQVVGLRAEAREKFTHLSPRTLGQAGRISGINPADLTVLWVYLRGCREFLRSPL